MLWHTKVCYQRRNEGVTCGTAGHSVNSPQLQCQGKRHHERSKSASRSKWNRNPRRPDQLNPLPFETRIIEAARVSGQYLAELASGMTSLKGFDLFWRNTNPGTDAGTILHFCL